MIIVTVALYVVDLLIAGLIMDTTDHVKKKMSTLLRLKYFKEAQTDLYFEIRCDHAKQRLYLTQFAYTRMILKRFDRHQCKPCVLSLKTSMHFTAEDKVPTLVPGRHTPRSLM